MEAFRKRFNTVPDAYGAYGYSGVKEIARGVELAKSIDSDAVAKALRANPTYDHYKGKQWWRPCDNKSFQDVYILRGREELKKFFHLYIAAQGSINIESLYDFTEVDNSISFQAIFTSNTGRWVVGDAWTMKDGMIDTHYGFCHKLG